MIQIQIHFCHKLLTFVATTGANFAFSCVHPIKQNLSWIFFKSTPNIHCTKTQTLNQILLLISYICGLLKANFVFLVLYTVYFQSFSDSHQMFIGLCLHSLVIILATRGNNLYSWPASDDISWKAQRSVVYKMSPPSLSINGSNFWGEDIKSMKSKCKGKNVVYH